MELQIAKNISESGQILINHDQILSKSNLAKKTSCRHHKKVLKKQKSFKKIKNSSQSLYKSQEKEQTLKAIQNLQQCQFLNDFSGINIDWRQSDFLKDTNFNFTQQRLSKLKQNQTNYSCKQTKTISNQICSSIKQEKQQQLMRKSIQITQKMHQADNIIQQSKIKQEQQQLIKSQSNKDESKKTLPFQIICKKIILRQSKKSNKNKKQIQDRVLKCKQVTISDLIQNKQTQRKNNYSYNLTHLFKRKQVVNKRKKLSDNIQIEIKSLHTTKTKLFNNRIQMESYQNEGDQDKYFRKIKTQNLSSQFLFKENQEQLQKIQNKLQRSSYSVDKRHQPKQNSLVQQHQSIFQKIQKQIAIKNLPQSNLRKPLKKELYPTLNKQKEKNNAKKTLNHSFNDFFVQNPQYLKKAVGLNNKNYINSPLRNYLKLSSTAYKKW